MPLRCILTAALLLAATAVTYAGDVIVQMPPGEQAAAGSANLIATNSNLAGIIQAHQILFANLSPDAVYNLTVAASDGKIYLGFDPNWFDPKSAANSPDSNPSEFTDDDRKQIQAILDIPSFYNSSTILWLSGDHNRAVVLVQLLRDQSFFNDKGGEVIWRVELQYFENENGGWARVPSAGKILVRKRFASKAEFHQSVDKENWTPTLGGISVAKDQTLTLSLKLAASPASTRPAATPAATEAEY